jgi:hypothetical protein
VPDTDGNLEEGEFVYDPETQTVTVNVGDSTQIPPDQPITLVGYDTLTLPTTVSSTPEILGQLASVGISVEGELSYQLTWEQHPSGSFQFVTALSNQAEIQDRLRLGTPIIFDGCGFRVTGLQITELPLTKNPHGVIAVSVSLGGLWQRQAELPVLVASGLTLTQASAGGNNTASIAGGGSYTVATIAARANVPWIGVDYSIRLPANTPSYASTTLTQAIDDTKRINYGYVRWSDPDAVRVIDLMQSSGKTIVEQDLSGAIASNYQGQGFYGWDGTPLALEYNNWELQWDRSATAENSDDPASESYTIVEGDVNPSSNPYGSGAAQDIGINADIGGITLQEIKRNYTNGTLVREEKNVWGLAFAANEVYDVVNSTGLNAAGEIIDIKKSVYNGSSPEWRVVEQEISSYTYSGGYLTGAKSSGFKITRFRSESANNPETLQIESDALGQPVTPRKDELLKPFRFFKLPTSSSTIYVLAAFKNYYGDIAGEDNPYFVIQEKRTIEAFASMANPENTAGDGKPTLLTTGKRSEFQKQTTILASSGSLEFYAMTESNSNSEGAGFQNKLRTGYTTQYEGRPPEQAKLNEAEPTTKEASSNSRYLIASPGYTPSLSAAVGGSYNAAAARSQTDALAAATANLWVENTRNAKPVQLQCWDLRGLKEGDLISFRSIQLRVLSLNKTYKIQGKVVKGAVNLTLGTELHPPVTFIQTTGLTS